MSDIKGAIRPFGISIDYDDTFTSCHETWTKVIGVLREAGAHVWIDDQPEYIGLHPTRRAFKEAMGLI